MASCKHTAFPLLVLMLGLTQCANEGRRSPNTGRLEPNRVTSAEPFMVPASGVDDSESRTPSEGRTERGAQQSELNDRQIAAASDRAHTAAIDQARLAFTKAKNSDVKSLAQMMLADHGRAKEQETALMVELHLSPEESSLATEIGVEAGKSLFALRESAEADFDRAYVDAQIGATERYIDALDKHLIPDARDERLTRALVAFRGRAKDHLEKAKAVKHALESETEMKGSVPASSGVQ